jgi:branched-chain amino acid transport system permease protein
VVAALGALVYGWFAVRLSGVYLAMLTLAFAQITWAITYQWDSFTGGSNGLTGVWPSEWLSNKQAYYWLTLVLVGAGVWWLRRVLFSPFGYALRAGRDSVLRADAIGIDVKRMQWARSSSRAPWQASPARCMRSPRAASRPKASPSASRSTAS